MTVARGFIPARLCSSRKTGTRDLPGETSAQGLGLLRSPTGINPLATEVLITTEDPIATRDPIATEDPIATGVPIATVDCGEGGR